MDTKNLLDSDNELLDKLQQIVKQTMEEEALITNNLLNEPKEMLTIGQSISDRVASFGGSWYFIIFFVFILFIWILFNSFSPQGYEFDPYPFILMNLILSCIAALQAPIIMMSQNRQEEKDRKRGENDYLVNLKAELEVRSLHQKMDLLLEGQILSQNQARILTMLQSIEEKLNKQKPS